MTSADHYSAAEKLLEEAEKYRAPDGLEGLLGGVDLGDLLEDLAGGGFADDLLQERGAVHRPHQRDGLRQRRRQPSQRPGRTGTVAWRPE
jgi:hypothetical protein